MQKLEREFNSYQVGVNQCLGKKKSPDWTPMLPKLPFEYIRRKEEEGAYSGSVTHESQGIRNAAASNTHWGTC